MPFNSWVQDEDRSYVLTLDSQIYCKEAVLNTAYAFTHRAHITVATSDPQSIAVRIILDSGGNDIQDVCREFLRELVDQQLRATIREETADIRKAIITEAFAPLEEARNNERP
jgi:His-Xaa-Ser system protein HxsD